MTIPKEALDAAAKAIYEVRDDPYDLGEWDKDLDAEDKERYQCDARAALTAALPHLREQLARMIDPDQWEFTDRHLHIFPENHPACSNLRAASLEKADAILAAGWQPPIPDRPNVITEN